MLSVDLHVHSLASACGLHSILELIEHGRRIGLRGMAITDHGPAIRGSRLSSVFFERFTCPYDDIKLYKGLELNVLDEHGAIDIIWPYMPFIDILLLGIHPNMPKGNSRDYYTDALLAAIGANPFVDIITHPNDPAYPIDYLRLAKAAQEHGIAVEINNSKVRYKRTNADDTLLLINACSKTECMVAICSDTHALLELGTDESVQPLLEQAAFPEHRIITRNLDSAAAFMEGRRGLKKEAVRRHRG
ncbi:MAG: PHP domain-containing protein [Chitinispirillaceae bacterium]|nr:PHP domain-containing protein [Chitinispirillaceae bacterium]